MKRQEFRARFGCSGPVVMPVIHVLDSAQTETNIALAQDAGCAGVFLINHDFGPEKFLPIIRTARARFADFWIGVNFLAVTGRDAFPVLGRLQDEGVTVDGYWADDARIDERRAPDDQPEAEAINAARRTSGWQGLYLGGTAFKKQREVKPALYGRSAEIARRHMDVVVTSGVATGHAADPGKIATFRAHCGDTALGVASGITPQNAARYAGDVDLFMVATGINHDGDFYNIDPAKLDHLMAAAAK